MKIVDASVAVKWFVNEPRGSEAATSLLLEIQDSPSEFAVPDSFFAEMLHVLSRIFGDVEKVTEALDILENLGFERVGLGHELLARAANIGLSQGVSGYDAIYAATAELTSGQWYTFDAIAHGKLKKLKVSRLVG